MIGMIFVFGSNLAGIHGGGAALVAHKKYGAEWGVGEGRSGDSYALPTKERNVATSRPLVDVAGSVEAFLEYAVANHDLEFQVTRIGCGLAGFADEDIAPMFKHAPSNCLFDSAWQPWLNSVRFWGTF
jgi:hypothetical protein